MNGFVAAKSKLETWHLLEVVAGLLVGVAALCMLAEIAGAIHREYRSREAVGVGLKFARQAVDLVERNITRNARDLSRSWNPPAGLPANVALDIDSKGAVTIAYSSDVAPSGANTLVLEPQVKGLNLGEGMALIDRIQWTCTGGTLVARYRPTDCR